MAYQDVLELPLIARKIASALEYDDLFRFACVSKDERFQEAISDFLEQARFVLDMRVFFRKWDTADKEYSDLLDHLTDAWTFDNVLREREDFFADRVIELCTYLRTNWNHAQVSQEFLKVVRTKLHEMGESFPACQYECVSFIHDMYENSG
jgi:hypothetical protein